MSLKLHINKLIAETEMKEKKSNVFEISSADLLSQSKEQNDTPKEGIDCNNQKKSKDKYTSFDLSESILFNTK